MNSKLQIRSLTLPFSKTTAFVRAIRLSAITVGAITVSAITLGGCADLNNPYPYGNSGSYGNYPPPAYGNSGYYGNDQGYDDRRERKELERERERLDRERRRLEDERYRQNQTPPPPVYRPPPPRPQERCPSGFSPSEQKCSREERKRGCQDMRLPGGLGCVRR